MHGEWAGYFPSVDPIRDPILQFQYSDRLRGHLIGRMMTLFMQQAVPGDQVIWTCRGERACRDKRRTPFRPPFEAFERDGTRTTETLDFSCVKQGAQS